MATATATSSTVIVRKHVDHILTGSPVYDGSGHVGPWAGDLVVVCPDG